MTIMCKHQSSSGKRKLNYSYVVVGNQCDQNLELKMAQFSPKFYVKRVFFKIAHKVAQYLG